MFRRLEQNLPKEPQFSENLEKLGFEINHRSQIVKIGSQRGDNEFFVQTITNNERVNDLYKDAIQRSVHARVLGKLSELGVRQLYVDDKQFYETKPRKPHVEILTTSLEKLRQKKDVIFIMGSYGQDLGIWSYQIMMGPGGMNEGSAIGLVKKLMKWQQNSKVRDSSNNGDGQMHCDPDLPGDLEDLMSGTTAAPGLIIVNPTGLHYSHTLNKSMSLASWLARRREHVLAAHTRIDDRFNVVAGHGGMNEHLDTVVRVVLPKITRHDVCYWAVCAGNGGDTILEHLDRHFRNGLTTPLVSGVRAITLADEALDRDRNIDPRLKELIAASGSQWVLSDEPKGTILYDHSQPTTQGVDPGWQHQEDGRGVDEEPSADLDGNDPGYRHLGSCIVYSSGVPYPSEAIWPCVIDDVLQQFAERIREAISVGDLTQDFGGTILTG